MTQFTGMVIAALEKSHYHLLPDLTNMIEEGKKINLITEVTVEFKQHEIDWIHKYQDKINLITLSYSSKIQIYDKVNT